MLSALVVLGGLGLPSAGAAPVEFSPTPLNGWSTNGTVRAVLIVGGTAYVGGDFTQVRGPGGAPTLNRARLAAFDVHTGTIRTGFAADANGSVRTLATDGTQLFVGGSFSTLKGVTRQRLGSVDLTTGNVLTGFQANANGEVDQLRVRQTRLFVGGAFTNIRGVARGRVAAVNTSTGVVDGTFNPDADNQVRGLALSPDGTRLYVGGRFTAIGGGSRSYIALVSPTTGALQPLTFQFSTYGQVLDLDLSPTGDRIFAALGDLENQAIAWNTSNGTRAWFYHVDGDTQAVKYFNGNVYFAFHEGAIGDTSVRMLVADAANGAIVPTYRLPINSFYGVWDIDATADALVIGGEFTQVNGRAVRGVAFLPDGVTPPPPPTTLVAAGSPWRYLANGSNQGTAWRTPAFADGSWAQGAAELGYGDGDEATVVPFGPNADQKYVTSYFRRQLNVNPATLGTVTLQLKRDDGAVVYLNGNEIVRSNLAAGTVTSTTLAADAGGTEGQWFSFTVPAAAFVNGTNTLAVEIHQTSGSSSDISFDLALTSTT